MYSSNNAHWSNKILDIIETLLGKYCKVITKGTCWTGGKPEGPAIGSFLGLGNEGCEGCTKAGWGIALSTLSLWSTGTGEYRIRTPPWLFIVMLMPGIWEKKFRFNLSTDTLHIHSTTVQVKIKLAKIVFDFYLSAGAVEESRLFDYLVYRIKTQRGS